MHADSRLFFFLVAFNVICCSDLKPSMELIELLKLDKSLHTLHDLTINYEVCDRLTSFSVLTLVLAKDMTDPVLNLRPLLARVLTMLQGHFKPDDIVRVVRI